MSVIFFLFFIAAVALVAVIISPKEPEKLEWRNERITFSNPQLPPKVTYEPNFTEKKQNFDIELLRIIEWKRYEEVCAAYLKEIGFICKTQDFGADGGIDIHLYWGSETNRVAIVQCKAWPDSLVGVKPIRELYGVMKSENVKKAFFMTSNDFTKEAKIFAQNKSLTLMTGTELVRRVNNFSLEKVEKLIAVATVGDFTTPTCVKCGKKMKMKQGSPNFWGCSGFPKCRNTMKAKVKTPTHSRSNMLY